MTAELAFGSARSGEYFMTSGCQGEPFERLRVCSATPSSVISRVFKLEGKGASCITAEAASRSVSGAAAQAFGGHHRQKSTGAVIEQSQARGLQILRVAKSLRQAVDPLGAG
jgi:hypothetical protein